MLLEKLLSGVFQEGQEVFDRAILALTDGSIFHGYSIGFQSSTSGEVVFNTSMTGYQEIISDPSYAGQIITLTYPHIGNVGCNKDDLESKKIVSNGLIIRDLPKNHSSHRAEESLMSFLKKNRVVAIAGIDTRKLTRNLRLNGAINGSIVTFQNKSKFLPEVAQKKAISLSNSCKSLSGKNLAKEVSTKKKYTWKETTWNFKSKNEDCKILIVVYDLGVKINILRNLVNLGVKIVVVPYETTYSEILRLGANGIFLSNGPGDPEPCVEIIDVAKSAIEDKLPIFGICLGHQILAIASGAKTKKMKVGHHGANHPVQELETGNVFITSQNHGFIVDEDSVKENLTITHRSLFDNSIQGLAHKTAPAFGFQGHPEASPGPHDLKEFFLKFLSIIESNTKIN